ncbi:hypothetical protein T11_7035 [Trichinella zimbabwensis]|uniref:Uncharacterized protein n=1 Tax=Trichinella zimbabwensis TaxID=268475 RepID=A0A0V1GSK2_9BILA|nr:hypothetical protein T11_7035 [Trichinella zimbabwensis]
MVKFGVYSAATLPDQSFYEGLSQRSQSVFYHHNMVVFGLHCCHRDSSSWYQVVSPADSVEMDYIEEFVSLNPAFYAASGNAPGVA